MGNTLHDLWPFFEVPGIIMTFASTKSFREFIIAHTSVMQCQRYFIKSLFLLLFFYFIFILQFFFTSFSYFNFFTSFFFVGFFPFGIPRNHIQMIFSHVHLIFGHFFNAQIESTPIYRNVCKIFSIDRLPHTIS